MDDKKFGGYDDFANRANEDLGRYQLQSILNPERLMQENFVVKKLNWKSIAYGDENWLNKIPDKRGIYAFTILWPSNVLPPHGYILYIGIAGRNSSRSLRERYKDYLNSNKIIKEMPRLAYAFGNWREVTRFFFAPVSNNITSEKLQLLEEQLNTALMPRYAMGDVDAEIRTKRKAFQ